MIHRRFPSNTTSFCCALALVVGTSPLSAAESADVAVGAETTPSAHESATGVDAAHQGDEPTLVADGAQLQKGEILTSVPPNGTAASSPASMPAQARSPNQAESDVISLADREGFRWQTRAGDFQFNPYSLVQTFAQASYSNNAWLPLTDQDSVRSVGFGTANAILGVAGRGFGRVNFNLALNPACSGGCLLNQAYVEFKGTDTFKIRVGKFKTPAHWSTQVRIGQTLMPRLPSSLMARVNLPFGLNSVAPAIATGFDTGLMVHGVVANRFEYQVGAFNGEGSGVNAPNSTLSDDHGLPGLLYAGRFTYHPLGITKPEESSVGGSGGTRLLLGLSTSYNVEANAESSDDWRGGFEAAFRTHGWYLAAEAYLLRMAFVERQRGAPSRTFLGSYAQLGWHAPWDLEPTLRLEWFDRNSTADAGVLLLPAAGVNWYVAGQNLKVSAMYQLLVRRGYPTEIQAHQDDSSISDQLGVVQLQFAL